MIITFGALLVAILIPITVSGFIYSRNYYKTGAFYMVLIAFACGVASYGIAALINSQILLANNIVNVSQLVKFITPWEEEFLKAILFLFLLGKVKNMAQFADWAIYGFAIGIGFAVAENFEYVLAYRQAAFGVAISRVISTNLMHASVTALAGTAFGISRFHSGIKKVLVIFGGLALGIMIHFGFNSLVNEVSSSFLLLYAASTGIAATMVIFFVIRWGLKQARKSIKEKLNMLDRVTSSESQLVQNYKKANKLLGPLEEMFGKTDGNKAHAFLQLQARIGIHRKNLEQFQDKKLIESTRETVEKMRLEMNQIRVELGPYKMLMIRQIFPASDQQLWTSLESTIEERMKSPSNTRGGLWDKLDSKVNK